MIDNKVSPARASRRTITTTLVISKSAPYLTINTKNFGLLSSGKRHRVPIAPNPNKCLDSNRVVFERNVQAVICFWCLRDDADNGLAIKLLFHLKLLLPVPGDFRPELTKSLK